MCSPPCKPIALQSGGVILPLYVNNVRTLSLVSPHTRGVDMFASHDFVGGIIRTAKASGGARQLRRQEEMV